MGRAMGRMGFAFADAAEDEANARMAAGGAGGATVEASTAWNPSSAVTSSAPAYDSSYNGSGSSGPAVKPVGAPSMFTQLFTGAMSQGGGAANTFTQASQGLYAAEIERAKAKSTTVYIVAGGVLVVGGFLAWLAMRK
jgi:hypothetical protein